MSDYIARFDHFRFDKDGGSLIVTSEISGFEEVYPWPDGWSVDDENIREDVFTEFYTDARSKYKRRFE